MRAGAGYPNRTRLAARPRNKTTLLHAAKKPGHTHMRNAERASQFNQRGGEATVLRDVPTDECKRLSLPVGCPVPCGSLRPIGELLPGVLARLRVR